MNKLFNVRLPVIIALSLAFGVATGFVFGFYDTDFILIIAVVPVTAVIFIVLSLIRRTRAAVFLLIAVAAFLLGAVLCRTVLWNFSETETVNGKSYTVTGTVENKVEADYGEYIILKNVTADGEPIGGKTRVYLGESYGQFCDIGYKVTFQSELTHYDAFTDGEASYNAINNIKYYCSVSGGLKAEYSFSLFGAVRRAIKNTLNDNLSKDSAAVVCALLLGDTDGVETGTLQAFRYGGIAHVFAVSGLHIGLVYGIFSFLLKKLGANKYLAAAVCLILIFMYSGVCGFSLSSVRALIMCAVSVVAKLTYNKYDSLNGLAVAVTLILIISPMSLFAVGFQLSVAAVFSIAVLSKQIAKLLLKIKTPLKLRSAVGVTLGAQLGTMPVMLASFGYLSCAGLVLNIIIIPVISALFTVILPLVALSSIIPAIAPVVVPAAVLPLEGVISFIVSFGFENTIITGLGSGLFAITYFIALIILSDKLNLRPKARCVALLFAVALLICCVLI